MNICLQGEVEDFIFIFHTVLLSLPPQFSQFRYWDMFLGLEFAASYFQINK